jgi:iron complex transport system substrate-binding protein
VEGGTVLKRALIALAAAIVVALPSASAAATSKLPHRIISLSPTATETLFAIGAGKQVIAVDDQSDYPKRAPRSKLSGYTPNVEAIAKYKPDLVVIANDVKGLRASLKKLHIKVVLQPAAKDLAGAYEQMRDLGVLTGHVDQTNRLIHRWDGQIRAAVSSVPPSRLNVYHELDPTLYSAKSNTFIGRVYELFGLRNIADAARGSAYPKLSSEYVVAANPDLIFLADSRCCKQTLATVSARPGWSGIAAVKNGKVFSVDDSVASRWGPRVVAYVQAVAKALKSG